MKHKIAYVMAALVIIEAAALLWNSSYQVARIFGIDSNVVDVFCYLVLGSAFYPVGKAVEKEEDYV